MASSQTLLYLRICMLFSIAFFFLKDPDYFFQFPFIILLTKSMDLPFVDIDPYNLIFGILSFTFALLGLSDLVPLLDKNVKYFETLVPARLLVFFGTATYACFGTSLFLCNNVVFIYCFFEIFFNALIFSTLKEEAYKRQQADTSALEDQEMIQEYMYGEGGENEDDPEYEKVISDIRERVQNL